MKQFSQSTTTRHSEPLKLLLAVSLVSLAFQTQPRKLDATAVYQLAKPALVLITAKTTTGETKQGSGVILSADGLIATNHHVMSGAVSAQVKLANGDLYEDVTLVDTDERKDLALLKIRAANLPTVQLADSESLQVGQTIFVLGAPFGLEGSLSQGLVSSIRPGAEIQSKLRGFRVIQFTAPISPGNSGGPLLDEWGKVVGLAFANLPEGQNLNLAIPSNYLSALVNAPSGASHPLTKMSAPSTPAAEITPAAALSSAKTICIWVVSGSPVFKTEVTNKLNKWGKLKIVSSPDDADLILRIAQTGRFNMNTGAGNQATALLMQRESGQELWGTTKGGTWSMRGWSEAWVARAIADEFIKFYKSIAAPSAKK
jgi:hypothetical protein